MGKRPVRDERAQLLAYPLPREMDLYKVVRRTGAGRLVSALSMRDEFVHLYAQGWRTEPRIGRLFAATSQGLARRFAETHRRALEGDTFEVWRAHCMVSALQPNWFLVPAPQHDPPREYDFDAHFQLPTEAYRAYWEAFEDLQAAEIMTRRRLVGALGIRREYVGGPTKTVGVLCDWIELAERIETGRPA